MPIFDQRDQFIRIRASEVFSLARIYMVAKRGQLVRAKGLGRTAQIPGDRQTG